MSKKYSQVDIEKGLIAAATLGIRPAARELGMNEATIRTWIRNQPARYAEIREQEAATWRARASAEFEDIVDSLSELEVKAMAKMEEELHRLEPKEVSGALKNISVAKGVNTQHVHNLRGQPNQIVEHRHDVAQLDSVIRELERLDAIDTTAVEINDVQLVEGQQG